MSFGIVSRGFPCTASRLVGGSLLPGREFDLQFYDLQGGSSVGVEDPPVVHILDPGNIQKTIVFFVFTNFHKLQQRYFLVEILREGNSEHVFSTTAHDPI